MSNPVNSDTVRALLDKLAIRYAETCDGNVLTEMTQLHELLLILHLRETERLSKRYSLSNHCSPA
jgi:hypothetical protein